MTTETRYFPLHGGLDLVTPAIKKPAGRAIAGSNYEPHPRGYQRVDGFERYDGHPKPSEASYWVLNFDAGTAAISEDDIVTGASSGATGRAVIDAVVESGSYAGSDAAGYLVLMAVSGTFANDENLQVSAATKMVANGTATEKGADNDTDNDTWLQSAIEKTRTDIAAIPGSGPVRGVWDYDGTRYAFRDNAGGTGCVMYKATASGWAAIDLGLELGFQQIGLVTLKATANLYELYEHRGGTHIAIKPDGTKLYMLVQRDLIVRQYSLTDGQLDTLTYDGAAFDLDISGQDLYPRAMAFKPDGTKLYIAGNENDKVYQYGLSTGWDLSTGAYDSVSFSYAAEDGNVRGIAFKDDGTKMYLLGMQTTRGVRQYTFATAWDLTTLSFDSVTLTLDPSDGTEYYRGIAIGEAGAKLFVVTGEGHSDTRSIRQYVLDTAWSMASATLVQTFSVVDAMELLAPGTRPDSVAFSADGLTMYVQAGYMLHQYDLSLAWDLETSDFDDLVLIEEGDTITGADSGATALVKRVVVDTGSFTTFDAVGRLVLDDQTGTFQTEKITVDGEDAANITGDSEAITLPAGGRYHFDNYNFFGNADLMRMYGVNGVGRGFEWDGTIFTPIETGMTDDRPIRVQAHRNHLFYAFRGGSVQHSSIGNPYEWDIITGAGEIGLGDEVTDMLASVSGTLSIFGRNKVAVLFGSDSTSWELRTLSDDSGAEPWTAQTIGVPVYLGINGLGTLETTEQFGDFRLGTITELVEPLFRQRRKDGATAVGSLRVRAKDQYRLFWSDGKGLTVYFGRQPVEILPFDLGMTVACTTSVKDSAGREWLLVGDDAGMVYELDVGTSFDGAAVDAFLRLAFNHVGSPAQNKRWQKADLELVGGGNTAIAIAADYGYGDPDHPAGQEESEVPGAGGFWNEAVWDNFDWSSPVVGRAETDLDGMSENVSLAVISNATYEETHILEGMTLHFSYRGRLR